MQAVILAAGAGTRLRPLTERLPKPMLPVAGDPMVARVADAAVEAGATELVVVVGYRSDRVREGLGDRYAGVPVTYVDQPERRGTADALRLARPALDGAFAVLNGDGRYEADDLRELFAGGPALGVHRVPEPSAYGVVATTDGVVDRVVEKPAEPSSNLVSTGACVLPESAAERAAAVGPSARGEYEMTDVLTAVIGEYAVTAVEFDAWRDVGRPWDLLAANVDALDGVERRVAGEVHPSATVRGPVVVASGAEVDAGVVVEGPAMVCAGARVGPNAYVRPGTVVGRNARVGHAVEVKRSVLLPGATAGHLAYVGDSVVGHDANLGAGTVVANLRHDGADVRVTVKGDRVSTGRRKFGVVVGPGAKTGIDTALAPGVTLGAGATTAPGETLLRDRADGAGPR